MSVWCLHSLISSQLHWNVHGFHKLHRNVHGFKKGIRKYISCLESRFRPNQPHSVLWTHGNSVSLHTQSSFIHDALKRARILRKAFGSAFSVRNRVSGLMNHFGCQERTKMSFWCTHNLISSQLHRNVDGFKKGFRKYITRSESRFRPNEPHSALWTHENFVSTHNQSSFIHDAPKRVRIVIKASGSAFGIRNRVSGLMNHFGC